MFARVCQVLPVAVAMRLIADHLRGGNNGHPFVHMTDNALAEGAECHFRNVSVENKEGARRPLFNLGGTVRVDPFVDRGVPYFIHDHFGPGRHAKIVSVKAKHLIEDGNDYREDWPLTGDETRVAEVKDVAWPRLLDPVDDLPPATVIMKVRRDGGRLIVSGVSHDNGEIASVSVNGAPAGVVAANMGVVDWQAEIDAPADGKLVSFAKDKAGNVEQTAHKTRVDK